MHPLYKWVPFLTPHASYRNHAKFYAGCSDTHEGTSQCCRVLTADYIETPLTLCPLYVVDFCQGACRS
jgi:hypothetical protein